MFGIDSIEKIIDVVYWLYRTISRTRSNTHQREYTEGTSREYRTLPTASTVENYDFILGCELRDFTYVSDRTFGCYGNIMFRFRTIYRNNLVFRTAISTFRVLWRLLCFGVLAYFAHKKFLLKPYFGYSGVCLDWIKIDYTILVQISISKEK